MSVAVKIQDKIIDKNYCDTQGLLKDNPVYKPFRAFVADNLNEKQRSFGFAMQSMFIGLASFIAGYLPQVLVNWFGVSREKLNGTIPQNILMSFVS